MFQIFEKNESESRTLANIQQKACIWYLQLSRRRKQIYLQIFDH
jgi:hypothetical protein